ncbi:hypothetical protein EPI10_007030 [Gossypium australe]|uniref:Reverse transcriptase Ty1/copia-type domain-containing protein n=1 Tax=Gossypium australe TaxID=47621 RepID=A0A5B6WVP9_9ROSI|nr:hypothetical protein EPI10_007030 [Gossypium australe]
MHFSMVSSLRKSSCINLLDMFNMIPMGDLWFALYGLRQAPRAWFDKLKSYLLSIGSSAPDIDVFVKQLHSKFSLKDMGNLHYFVGVEVTRLTDGTLHLCQCKYVLDLLDCCHLAHAKVVHTPMVSSSFLSKTMGTPIDDLGEYRSLASTLQYVVLTRPDIAYVVNHICQFMYAPTNVHLVALK